MSSDYFVIMAVFAGKRGANCLPVLPDSAFVRTKADLADCTNPPEGGFVHAYTR